MAINNVFMIGRVTKDVESRYTTDGMCVVHFNVALDRGKKDGKDLGADYPRVVCFGKTAENVEKYVKKGSLVGVMGHIHTDSYEKDGKKVFTMEVTADRIEFLTKAEKTESKAPTGFSISDEDIPF